MSISTALYDWFEYHRHLKEPEEPWPSGAQLSENTEVLESNGTFTGEGKLPKGYLEM